MNKCYVVMWDQDDDYGEQVRGPWCVCKTLEQARKICEEMRIKVAKDARKMHALRKAGKCKEADEIADQYEIIYDCHNLWDVTFFLWDADYYDE